MEVLGLLRTMMWLLSAVAILGTIIIGIIFGYHWIKYSGNPRSAKLSIFFYSAVSIVILLSLVGSIPA